MFRQIFVNQMRPMWGHVVVVLNPISYSPQLRGFSGDSFSKTTKNVPVHCPGHSKALWNVLLMKNALTFAEDFQHNLVL